MYRFGERIDYEGWQTVKTPGWGRSCPPIVKVIRTTHIDDSRLSFQSQVESSVVCSLKDIVNVSVCQTLRLTTRAHHIFRQGFDTLLASTNNESWLLHMGIRRGEGFCVNMDFERTGPENGGEPDPRADPAGCIVRFKEVIDVDLWPNIRPDI